ncbi:mutS protein homolog 4-like isoform X2 [Frieseomelitta varia]|uniref:mutS protein homolog 4-like isoform X2 n=1 Tax=Frieseomelitta varia TaxID=561572 RepID=UPI001CB67E78|nr:mutS protein homolog 4-like isoform X2 [Frieseomelitta varia]
MNVIRTETALKPQRKQPGTRFRQQFNVPLTKRHFKFDIKTKRGTNWKSATTTSASHSKTPKFRNVQVSSSLRTSTSRNYVSRSGTKTTTGPSSSLLESAIGSTVVAITTGRGDARSEVGIASLDIRCPHLILCQISDSQTYINALSKLYLFDPMEILMPDTMCECTTASNSVLYRSIMDKFPETELTPISRVHFNDTIGLERIKSLCNPEYSSVELFVKQKYYALAAAAALLKYVEYAQRIIYTPQSMKIEFQGSPNAATIDLESARSLELVQSQCGERNVSLLGSLDRCLTPMGRKLLRANILQPSCEEQAILERQAAVAELVSNCSLRALIQPIVRRLYGADRLLILSTTPALHESNVQTAEQNLNYVLLLKNLLEVVPELEKILLAGKSDLLCKIQKKLKNDDFRLMRERIVETIHPDARSVTGHTSSNMQRCFAIRAGINDLLDIARQTYCELIDDMKSMVENLASKYKLTLSLSCNASLGYHVQAMLPRNLNAETFDLPSEFIEIRRNKRVYTMTTNALATLNQQCKIACEELHLMSNVLLHDLLQSVREYIGCLFQLSADIAELDLVTSLAQVSSLPTYTRPSFGSKLELIDSRHPVMDVLGFDGPVPNNVNASIPQNLCIISGPNMSGKSTYLKQIVLLHVMAQLGCFVPAKEAMFRITDLIFCKIAIRDDIECNASTFALEMKEAQYILRSVTATSLIILDELCKGTAIEEGASIAWATCEKLLNTTAFIFAATHFTYLTKLADLYCNVTNRYFETINGARGSEADNINHRLTYTHRLKSGVAHSDDYGIVLAELSGLPKSVTEKARKYASEQVVTNQVTTKSNSREKTCYNSLVKLYELLETNKFHQKQVTSLIRCFVKLWKQGSGEGTARENKETTNENNIDTQKDNESDIDTEKNDENDTDAQKNSENDTRIEDKNEYTKDAVSDRTNTINSGINFGNETEQRTYENVIESREIPAVLSHATSSGKRNESLDVSLNWIDRRSSSVSVNKISNKSDETLSLSDNLECRFHKNFEGSYSSMCSTIHRTISSTSFVPSVLSPVSQMSISTMEKSTSELYEYCLSDDDFDISHISVVTNQSTINET